MFAGDSDAHDDEIHPKADGDDEIDYILKLREILDFLLDQLATLSKVGSDVQCGRDHEEDAPHVPVLLMHDFPLFCPFFLRLCWLQVEEAAMKRAAREQGGEEITQNRRRCNLRMKRSVPGFEGEESNG